MYTGDPKEKDRSCERSFSDLLRLFLSLSKFFSLSSYFVVLLKLQLRVKLLVLGSVDSSTSFLIL